MKAAYFLIVLIISTVFIASAYAEEFPFLVTALSKNQLLRGTYPKREVEVRVEVITDSNIDRSKEKDSVLYALRFHEKVCEAFMRKGWRKCHPLDQEENVGSIELGFEPRMNLKLEERIVMKTY